MWPFKKPCRHLDMRSTFKNLHRGADDEIYVRHVSTCRECGWSRWFAVRLPDVVTEAIDAQVEIGRLQKKGGE